MENTVTSQNLPESNETTGLKDMHKKKNLYPVARHILLVACVLLTLFTLIFLIYQNGKSIYDNGL